MPQQSSTVAFVGATGYTGGELLGLLSRHPGVERVLGVANERAGNRVAEVWPRLGLRGGFLRASRNIDEVLLSLDALLASPVPIDAVFLCLPHEAPVDVRALISWARGKHARLLDVGDSLRAAALGGEAGLAYGLPELFSSEILAADVIACAGCYPTSVLLAAAPLVAAGALDEQRPLIVDSKSGARQAPKALARRDQGGRT